MLLCHRVYRILWAFVLHAAQVNEILCSYARFGRSILYFAAKSGNMAVFEAILDILEGVEEGKVFLRVSSSWCTTVEQYGRYSIAWSGMTNLFAPRCR